MTITAADVAEFKAAANRAADWLESNPVDDATLKELGLGKGASLVAFAVWRQARQEAQAMPPQALMRE